MIKRFFYVPIIFFSAFFTFSYAFAFSDFSSESSEPSANLVFTEEFHSLEIQDIFSNENYEYFYETNTEYLDSMSIENEIKQEEVFPVTTFSTENYNCPQHLDNAIKAGWSSDLLKRLDTIIWRESRCIDDAYNDQDPNGGSHGITQVNGFWCRPSRYHPNGWLQEQNILNTCQELYDPYINLVAAKAIYEYSKRVNNCGFSPWSTKNQSWC
jgi:hypothetical protein